MHLMLAVGSQAAGSTPDYEHVTEERAWVAGLVSFTVLLLFTWPRIWLFYKFITLSFLSEQQPWIIVALCWR